MRNRKPNTGGRLSQRIWSAIEFCIFCLMFVVNVHVFNECAISQTRSRKSRPRLTAREIAQKSLAAVVMVTTRDSEGKPVKLGSGFFVRPNVIATNYHVIEGASTVYVKHTREDFPYRVIGIVGMDRKNDLVLLKLAHSGPVLPLGNTNQTEIGDEVFVVGSPQGLEGTFSQGIISGLRRRYVQITAPISSGSSGGPVLDAFGNVIGIAVSIFQSGQNLNFAIPVSHLSTLVSQMGAGIGVPVNQTRPVNPVLPDTSSGRSADGSPSRSAGNNLVPVLEPPPPPPVKAPPSLQETSAWLQNKLEGLGTYATKGHERSIEHISISSSCNMDLRLNVKQGSIKWVSQYSPTLHLVEGVEAGQDQFGDWIIWLKFRSRIYEYNEFYDSFGQLIRKTEERRSRIAIFVTEDLAVRGANAFNNLIKICGGGVKKEPF